MRLTFESEDRVKQIALPNMSGPIKPKRLTLQKVGGNYLLTELRYQSFPAFALTLQIWPFLDLQPSLFGLKLTTLALLVPRLSD